MTGTAKTGTVKICSLRRPEDGIVASEAGADFAGLIFAQAKRQVSVEQAAEIVTAVRSQPENRTKLVGVFVNEDPRCINLIVARLELDYVQLNGHEPAAQLGAIERPVIKALRLPLGTTYDDARMVAEHYLTALDPAVALLIDAHVAGAFGGTGRTGDWTLSARLAESYPIILAGGLNPENVAEAIATVRPLGVDVSSGVETDGMKDHEKIRAFVRTGREAFEGAALTPYPERSISQFWERGLNAGIAPSSTSRFGRVAYDVCTKSLLPELGEGVGDEGEFLYTESRSS